MDAPTACVVAICWALPALAYIGGAHALRAVRSFVLSCALGGSSAFGLQLVFGGDLLTWLTAVACAYVAGFVGAHALCMLAVKFYSGQAGVTAAAHDSYQMRPSPARKEAIKDTGFYEYYNGHEVRDLRYIHQRLRALGCRSFLFLAGDSSFDNKHWFFRKGKETTSNADGSSDFIAEDEMRDDAITAPAVNGYEEVLVPATRARTRPRMARDVCFWLNEHAPGNGDACTIMSAVEASTAADRCEHGLLKQDEFIRDTLTPDDYVLISVGGNDIAMAPTIATVVNVGLLAFSPFWLVWLGLAPGYAYLVRWMGSMVVEYVGKLAAKRKPKKVVCCMIYFPDVTPSGGWADMTLGLLLYRRQPGFDATLARVGKMVLGSTVGQYAGLLGFLAFPSILQTVIRALYGGLAAQLAKARRPGGELEGLDVVAFPLFEVLDGQTTADYNQRVEPSVQGGEKMAKALLAELGLHRDSARAASAEGRRPAGSARPSRSPRRRAR